MMDFANKIFRGDRVIWMIFLFLCLISIVEVYSASSQLTFRTNYWQPILRHTGFLLLGMVVILLIHSLSPKYFWFFAVLLPIAWALLIATQFMGKTIGEAQRYIFGFQPSEMAKLSLIASVAFILSGQKNNLSEKAAFRWIWSLTIITCILILRDNFSTAAILYTTIGIMMFIGQVSFKRIMIFFSVTCALIALIFSFCWIYPEQAKSVGLKRVVVGVSRITDYKEKQEITPTGKIPDDQYQVSMANVALARGGFIGNMPGNGRLSDFLPQAYSDFIYAIILEETGLFGGIFVLALYVFLFIRAGTIAGRCKKIFPKFLVMGSAIMITIQAMVNMAVSVGLMPVTGQPLPLISKGGSSILITCIFIGIMLSVSRFENPRGIQQEEEFEEEFEEERRSAYEGDEQLEAQSAY